MDVSTHSDTAIDNRIHHRRDHSTSSTITSPVTGNIPSADSSQQLIVDSHGGSLDDSIGGELGASNQQRQHRQMYGGSTLRARVSPAEWFAMFVLCFVNLINYMDRFTIAGELNFCLYCYGKVSHFFDDNFFSLKIYASTFHSNHTHKCTHTQIRSPSVVLSDQARNDLNNRKKIHIHTQLLFRLK